MNGMKTFPLIMSEGFHKRLRDAAYKTDKHMKDFIAEAVEREIKKVENTEQK